MNEWTFYFTDSTLAIFNKVKDCENGYQRPTTGANMIPNNGNNKSIDKGIWNIYKNRLKLRLRYLKTFKPLSKCNSARGKKQACYYFTVKKLLRSSNSRLMVKALTQVEQTQSDAKEF